jgi:hypothetical protein
VRYGPKSRTCLVRYDVEVYRSGSIGGRGAHFSMSPGLLSDVLHYFLAASSLARMPVFTLF